MRKRYKKKRIYMKVLPVLICILVLGLSIGFSAYEKQMLVTDIMADIRLRKDIRVTSVGVDTVSTDTVSKSLDYNNSNISDEVHLPYENSTITYEVEITNIENAEMGIYNLTLSNSNLDYTINNYTKRTKLCDDTISSKCNLDSKSTLSITIFYKENMYDLEELDQTFILDFNFRGFYSVTYNGISGTYQSEIMDGDTLEVDFDTNALGQIKVTMGGDTLTNQDYTYTNGILTIPDVSGNIVIGPKETDESCFVSTKSGQINNYICEDTDVIIPEGIALKVNGSGNPVPITTLGNNAFKDKGLTSVVIPEGITKIRSSTFQNNLLTSITFPSTLTTIEAYAFDNNHIEELTISNSITSLGTYSFRNNYISSLTLPNNITTIPSGIFQNNRLESISIPNSVVTIDSSSFQNNRLSELTIPASVTTINMYAFKENYIETLVIPNTVTTLGIGVFSNNLISSIVIGSGLTAISNNAFMYNKLTSVNIPDTVTSIGNGAFSYNDLTSVTIGNGVTSFGNECFYGYTTTRSKYDETTITYGPNVITRVIIDNSSKLLTIPNSTFKWASGYGSSNICWLGDDPTCGN